MEESNILAIINCILSLNPSWSGGTNVVTYVTWGESKMEGLLSCPNPTANLVSVMRGDVVSPLRTSLAVFCFFFEFVQNKNNM